MKGREGTGGMGRLIFLVGIFFGLVEREREEGERVEEVIRWKDVG